MENNIKLYLIEIGWEDTELIYLAQDRGKLWVLVNTVMNLWVPQNAWNFLTS
jgi:hypothetical protein